MPKQIISKTENEVSVTQHSNNFYRIIGLLFLIASIYILLYPVFTGMHIIHNGQLELTYFAVPGFIAGLLALKSKQVSFNKDRRVLVIKYMSLIIPLFKKTHLVTGESELVLFKDDKDIPMTSHPAPNEMFSNYVAPWYVVKFVSGFNELHLIKTTSAKEAKEIALSISKIMNIPAKIEEPYPDNS